MLFNSIKKSLLVFSILLLVCGNTSFSSNNQENNINQNDNLNNQDIKLQQLNAKNVEYSNELTNFYSSKEMSNDDEIAKGQELINGRNNINLQQNQESDKIKKMEDVRQAIEKVKLKLDIKIYETIAKMNDRIRLSYQRSEYLTFPGSSNQHEPGSSDSQYICELVLGILNEMEYSIESLNNISNKFPNNNYIISNEIQNIKYKEENLNKFYESIYELGSSDAMNKEDDITLAKFYQNKTMSNSDKIMYGKQLINKMQNTIKLIKNIDTYGNINYIENNRNQLFKNTGIISDAKIYTSELKVVISNDWIHQPYIIENYKRLQEELERLKKLEKNKYMAKVAYDDSDEEQTNDDLNENSSVIGKSKKHVKYDYQIDPFSESDILNNNVVQEWNSDNNMYNNLQENINEKINNIKNLQNNFRDTSKYSYYKS